jgi:hypothetical protein
MRGLTSQCAADLKFLLNGRDGRPDRMVSVETYMKGKSREDLQAERVQNNTTMSCESLACHASNTAPNSICRE